MEHGFGLPEGAASAVPAVPAAPAGIELPEGLALGRGPHGLVLSGDGMELSCDFRDLLPRVRADRIGRELLVRAARVRRTGSGEGGHPTCVDATAGLGTDGFLLAAAGFHVLLCEADPVIGVLLADAVARAADDPDLAAIAARVHVLESDSVAVLAALPEPFRAPDVVYLDPMFPERRKSAAVKKKFQLLHRLERPCGDVEAERLLAAAIAAGPRKVVVKRPAKGPHLAGAKPSHAISGKAVRFDVIVPACGSARDTGRDVGCDAARDAGRDGSVSGL